MPHLSEYHAIVVQEGFRNPTVLDEMKILGKKVGKKWTLLKIGVDLQSLNRTIRTIQANLLSENGIPYYAHLYRNDELVVVFPERVFRMSTDKNTWTDAVSYGQSLKIPKSELDFKPCRIADETF